MASPRIIMFTDGAPDSGSGLRACLQAHGLSAAEKDFTKDPDAAGTVLRICGEAVSPVLWVNDRWLPDPTQEELLRATGVEFDPEPLDSRGRTVFDVIVIGLGPAGLAACHGCRLAGLSVLGVDQHEPGGHLLGLPVVGEYLGVGYDDIFSGEDLADNFAAHARAAGAVLVKAKVEGVGIRGQLKRVRTGAGDFWARAVVVATGAEQRRLEIKGVEPFVGTSVQYGPQAEARQYVGRRICVVGSGDAALNTAIFLAQHARHVTLLCPAGGRAAEPALMQRALALKVRVILGAEVVAVAGSPGLDNIYFMEDGEPEEQGLPIDALVIVPGTDPKSPIPGLEALPQENGYYAHGEGGKTMFGGIYVAGDCTNMELRTLVGVVASGSLCARRLWQWLAASPLPRLKG